MTWMVGRGIGDVTGEAAECGMLGYGKAEQRTAGIHLRQRSRAFVFDDGASRALLVIVEIPLPMQSITDAVHKGLKERYGDTYSPRNVMITVTHTHAGPGGYCGHTLYNLTTQGFRERTFTAIVDGILESIEAAHADLGPAELALAIGELRNASANRSRSSFERNPAADRAFFPDAIDPQTTLLSVRRGDTCVGAINFFATHGTSMSNKNPLISSDNKGYAAYHWERLAGGTDYLAEEGPDSIAAFAQTNAGDMSPNLDAGVGPTDDEFENTRIIGTRQFEAAAALLAGPSDELGEGIDSRATYVDLGNVEVRPEFTPDGKPHRTGPPMLAAAATAGTDEGKGFAGFRQGLDNPPFDAISRRLYHRKPALADQHAPKAILASGRALNRVTDFVQERVPVQLLRLGNLYLIGIPAEVTIVSGLRLRRTVAGIVGAPIERVLVVGYCNAYVHYVTTPEEYLAQRYEGGSTIFGRWELPALQQVVAGLAEAMRDHYPVDLGMPPVLRPQRSWVPKARVDTAPGGFGAVTRQPRDGSPGDRIRAEFESAYPNNDLRRGSTYLEVQREVEPGRWVRVADDGDWSTLFRWKRVGRSKSRVAISWDVPADAVPGTYRIVHHMDVRRAGGAVTPVSGISRGFAISPDRPGAR